MPALPIHKEEAGITTLFAGPMGSLIIQIDDVPPIS